LTRDLLAARTIDNSTVDEMAPARIVRLADADELSDLLADVNGAGEHAIPWGGGDHIHIGNTPAAYDVAIDLSRIVGIIEYEPADMTIVARGGEPISSLQAVLAKEGQRLTLDMPDSGNATVGGALAANAVTPIRSSAGGLRDVALGLTVVEADGAITKSGGRVVKNVQGYDLVRLHTGALGTLGIIVEAAFKVAPIPATSRTVIGWFEDIESASNTIMTVFNGSFMPEALSLVTGDTAGVLVREIVGDLMSDESSSGNPVVILGRCAGGFPAVARQVDELTSLLGSEMASGMEVLEGPDADRSWSALTTADAPELSLRTTLKPTNALKLASDLGASANPPANLILHAGYGTLLSGWVGLDEKTAPTIHPVVTKMAGDYGANVLWEHCPALIKQDIDVWGNPGPELAIARRLKEQFDPKGTLNAGRFMGKI
jgi:glycolate oxidase FAD binding subunit